MAYRVKQGWLGDDGSGEKPETPLAEGFPDPAVVHESARLLDAGDAEYLAFVERWGLLGYETYREGADEDWRRHLPEPPQNPDSLPYWHADPMPWLRAHVRGVRFALELRQRIGDPADLRRYMEASAPPRMRSIIGGPQEYGGSPVEYTEHGRFVEVGVGPNVREVGIGIGIEIADPVAAVPYFLQYMLSADNLGPIRHRVRFRDSGWEIIREPTCLLAGIYYRLAEAIEGPVDRRFVRCEYCGTPFLRTDRRQRFCPPPRSGPYAATESACGLAKRQREWRKRVRNRR